MPHHYSSVTVLAAVAFGVAVVTPTGVSSFSVSKQMAEPTSASASASRLFQKRSSGTLRGTWNDSSDGTVEESSWITLRGGSGSSDAESTPTDSNMKSTTTANRTPISGASEAYYLLWSKGFVPKLAL